MTVEICGVEWPVEDARREWLRIRRPWWVQLLWHVQCWLLPTANTLGLIDLHAAARRLRWAPC